MSEVVANPVPLTLTVSSEELLELLNKDRPPLLTFSSDGSRLAFAFRRADDSSTIVVWDISSGEQVWHRRVDAASALALSPEGTVLAIGYEQGRIQVVPLRDGDREAKLLWHAGKVRTLAFDRDRLRRKPNRPQPIAEDGGEPLRLASGDAFGHIVVWDLATQHHETIFRGNPWDVFSLAFRPDGATLATGGRRFVNLWDIATGRLLLSLKADDRVHSLDFDHTGRKLAACARNPFDPKGLSYSAFVYTIEDGRGLQTMRGLANQVIQVHFSADRA